MKRYLLASDFDQTLSFNDSGIVLSELLGLPGFSEKSAGLSRTHLVQQGAELAYLLLHDPAGELDGYDFTFYVISAAPQEVIQSALEGIVPSEQIHGTRFRYHPVSGEIESIERVTAGYGKVALLEQLRGQLPVSHDRVVYVGDGSSDIHVMLHVNRLNGMTIAVSENKYLAQIAKRTVISDDAVSVLVPILEDIVGLDAAAIHALFESKGLVLQEWDKVQTDLLTIREADAAA
ncbi:MAG: haloacid dehalogenase [Gemmatimonadetes bacterium]|nr:MAG: haloacid dehalogenase [Gemmatimonadota bacterium]